MRSVQIKREKEFLHAREQTLIQLTEKKVELEQRLEDIDTELVETLEDIKYARVRLNNLS